MSQDLADELLDGVNSTTRWFRATFPDEEIVFASAASYGEFQGRRRQGWGRKGVLILTGRQVFFKAVWRSLYTLIFLAAGIVSFIVYTSTEEVLFLILAIAAIAATFNRLPFQRQILLGDAKGVEAGSDKGLTLRGMRDMGKLDITMDDHTVRFSLNQTLTDEARHVLDVPAGEDLGGF